MRFWISWVQQTEDYSPLTFPPNAAILGWWCSGYAEDGATLCAVVAAGSEDEAKAAIVEDWPEASKWRFVEPKGAKYIPGGRFPQSEWMKERLQ